MDTDIEELENTDKIVFDEVDDNNFEPDETSQIDYFGSNNSAIDSDNDSTTNDYFTMIKGGMHDNATIRGGKSYIKNKRIDVIREGRKKDTSSPDSHNRPINGIDDDQQEYDQTNVNMVGADSKMVWSETKRIHDDANLYAKQIEQVRDMHHIYREALTECYKVVSNYIIRNKRILVGGMAIDNALRAKGSYLYDTSKVDYDFISPDFHKDAYNIGQELAKKFSGVSIIGARHVSTMRVRYEFIPVADITYVPKNIYDNIPVIEYMGMKNIHPHFQMIDQHRAMTHGLENPPQETIISSRYEKDVKRYILLSQFYPIPVPNGLKVKLNHYEVPYSYVYGNCLGGYASAIYWLKKIGINTNASIAFSRKKLHLSIPDDGKIVIISDDFKSLLRKFPDAKLTYYNSFLDKASRHIEVETTDMKYDIYDNKGEKIVAEDLGKLHILGMSGTMAWLLLQGLFYKNEWCLYLYKHLKTAFISDGHTKYLPSFTFYGKYNWSDSYLLHLDRQLNKLGYKKLDTLSVPRNFHPKQGDTIPEDAYKFDPVKSVFYQQDGQQCDPFEEIQLPE
jgi:hypothetical protein